MTTQPAPSRFGMSQMVNANLRHNWRVSMSVALGVATATAVIVGALLVGDSMRGSLRALTVQRLGKIEAAVMPGTFFRAEGIVPDGVPVILFVSGVVEANGKAEDDPLRRAGAIQIIGCDERFWELDTDGRRPSVLPNDEGVVLNRSAADELGVEVGDRVTVRLPVEQAVPADSPLGRRETQSEGLPRMEVLEIIPDRGLGRFSLSPSQASPQNVYLRRETIAEVLDREGQANSLLLTSEIATEDLDVRLDDLGLSLDRITQSFAADGESAQTVFDYYSLTSAQLLLPDTVVERVREEFPAESVVPVTTYLANALERRDPAGAIVASVPYSTITGIDGSESLPLDYTIPTAADGPTAAADPNPADNDVDEEKVVDLSETPWPQVAEDAVPLVLNRWAADWLDAERGMPLRVAYFEPEVEQGREVERYFDAVVTEIVPLTEPKDPYTRRNDAVFDQPPTLYNDPHLTPSVPGVTDQASILDWDLPFTLTRKVNDQDDAYWNNHRLTPKAFLPESEARRLFGSRFGQTTSLRIATEVGDEDAVRRQILETVRPSIDRLGWAVLPLRRQQLQASRGTTPFDALFLALSFFVILAAVMLIAMLFRLGLVERMPQFGTLLAVGFPPRRVAAVARYEGMLVAAIGVAIGLAGGFAYAAVVLWALRSFWVGAVTVPFLTFHWTGLSLAIGALSGWLVAVLTLVVTSRALMKVDVRSLLSGRDTDTATVRADSDSRRRRVPIGSAVLVVIALAMAGAGASVGGQAAAGGFVGGGMMLLVAAMMAIYHRLRQPRRIGQTPDSRRYSLGTLASRNGSRHPLRSTLTIGLMATATFLIIAISAFRLEPSEKGTGGFDLIGQTAQPLFRDLGDAEVRSNLLGAEANLLDPNAIETNDDTGAPARERPKLVAMRLKLGQDASCNNLYQATRPTVLGVPPQMSQAMRGEAKLPGFQWWASGTLSEGQSPWDLLGGEATGTPEDPIPMILDQNTAMYSLQMRGGVGEVKSFEYARGEEIHFRVVGLLANSVLQGKLLIGNDNFETAFPKISGYRFFLIACDESTRDAVASSLENRLSDVGMDVSDARVVLSGLMAVQNTYLRTFQSLGALGLLLGTVGLAVSQLRSVLERRRELAVLRAIGFTRRRLATMVMSETTSLLLAGIGCGALCAVLAVIPHAWLSGLKPPLVEPLVIVVAIIVFGLFAGALAVGRVARMPLLASLRSQ